MPGVWGDTSGADSPGQGDIINGANTGNDYVQLPWNTNDNSIDFISASPVVNLDTQTQGWQGIPNYNGGDPLPHFDLNTTFRMSDPDDIEAVQPFYITSGYDASVIKRAIIVMPGKPRDSWKYSSLIYNALSVATRNLPRNDPKLNVVNKTEVLIIGPAWLNQADQTAWTAGAFPQNWLLYHGSQWQSGGHSRWPTGMKRTLTTYEVMDKFLDMLFDVAQFPAMNQVVVAGHSMGGQAVQRYALLKKAKPYDANVRFWIGNPGSYAWLTEDRPFPNTTCTPDVDQWIYGIRGNQTFISKYARRDVMADTAAGGTVITDRYRSRNIHYAYGLLDQGPGDTHCQAIVQGGNHLDRGAHFVQMLGGMPGGFPASQTVDFIAGTSHQDYPMLSANQSLIRLFSEEWETRPNLVPVTNPGDSNSTSTSTDPTTGEKAFATPIHLIMAYSLLFGSIFGVFVAFTIMPCIFPVDRETWDGDGWDPDSKTKLL